MEVLTTGECGMLWGISQQCVSEYCRNGKIKGAFEKNSHWYIPFNTEIIHEKSGEDDIKIEKGTINIKV